MNFEFSEEQNLLREQAQSFLKDQCSLSAVRAVLDGEQSFDEGLWQQVAAMGWTATTIPEEYDGLGLSYLELSVIAEELGRQIAPIPFSSSVYLATEAILLAGSDAQNTNNIQMSEKCPFKENGYVWNGLQHVHVKSWENRVCLQRFATVT